MMALPSVLLPLPLGPISAWVSPRLSVRLTPFRIGLPSTLTCRSLITSDSVMTSRQVMVVRRAVAPPE